MTTLHSHAPEMPGPASAVAARFTKEYGAPVADGDLMTWILDGAGGERAAVTVVLATATPKVSIFAPQQSSRPKVSRTLVGQEHEAERLVRAINRRRAA